MGKTLEDLDVSNCAVSDNSCEHIARHCQAIKALGFRNIRTITGAPLIRLFTDKERRKNVTAVTLSGSKEVSQIVPGRLMNVCVCACVFVDSV